MVALYLRWRASNTRGASRNETVDRELGEIVHCRRATGGFRCVCDATVKDGVICVQARNGCRDC